MASQFLRLFAILSSLTPASSATPNPSMPGQLAGAARRLCSVGSLSVMLASGILQAQALPVESERVDAGESPWGAVPAPTPEMLAADRALAESRVVPAAQTARSLVVSAGQPISLQATDAGEVSDGSDGISDEIDASPQAKDASEAPSGIDVEVAVEVPVQVSSDPHIIAAASVPAQRYRSVEAKPVAPSQGEASSVSFQATEAALIEQMAASRDDEPALDAGQRSASPVSSVVPASPSVLLDQPLADVSPPVPSSPVVKPKLRLSRAAQPIKATELAMPAPPAPRSAIRSTTAPRLLADKDLNTPLLGQLARRSSTTSREPLPVLAPAAYPGHAMESASDATASPAAVVGQALPPLSPAYGQAPMAAPAYVPGYGQPLPQQGYPQYAQPQYVQPYAQPQATPQYPPQPYYGAPVGQPMAYPVMPQPYYVVYSPTGMPMYMAPVQPYPMAGYGASGYAPPGYAAPMAPTVPGVPAVGYQAPGSPVPGYAPAPGYPVAYPAPAYPQVGYAAPGYPSVAYPTPSAYSTAPAAAMPGYVPVNPPVYPNGNYAGAPQQLSPQPAAPFYGGNVAAAPAQPLLLPSPPLPGSYGNNFGLVGSASSATYAPIPAPPGLNQPSAWGNASLSPGASPGGLPAWPTSLSGQPVPNQVLPDQPSMDPPPLDPQPVLATPAGTLPTVGQPTGAAVGGPLDGPATVQTSPGVTTPPPVPEVQQGASLPQFRDGQLLRTNALARPNYFLQGVFLSEGSDTSTRARITTTYPLTSNLLFGGSFDVSTGDSFAVGESNGFTVNELYAAASLEQLPNLRFAVGQLDLTSYFDRNSFAKDSATHFFNTAFQTNPALSATGIASRTGMLLNWTATDNIELKAAAFSSDDSLGGFALDGFAGEVGVRYGNAIIRGTYASDKDSGNDDGFQEVFSIARSDGGTGLRSGDREQAYGVNAEWYVPNLKMGLFGRYGRYENLDLDEGGDTFGLGFNFQDVFSQDDRIGLAYGRNLSNESLRRDFNIEPAPDVLELFYDFRFLPNLRLGFSLQGRDEFSEAVAGFRLKAEFDPVPRGNLTNR